VKLVGKIGDLGEGSREAEQKGPPRPLLQKLIF